MSEPDCQHYPSFSQRNGYKAIPSPLKPEELTQQLRIEFSAAIREAIDAALVCVRRDSECYKLFKVANWHEVLRLYWIRKLGVSPQKVMATPRTVLRCFQSIPTSHKFT